jgi:antitoxin VapB
MSLNIKDPETHRLAQALAQATGESMTHAVREALRERLERLRRSRRPVLEADELLAIGRRCSKLRTGPKADHGELLYDEQGLPR